jgi:hypothetical protein
MELSPNERYDDFCGSCRIPNCPQWRVCFNLIQEIERSRREFDLDSYDKTIRLFDSVRRKERYESNRRDHTRVLHWKVCEV